MPVEHDDTSSVHSGGLFVDSIRKAFLVLDTLNEAERPLRLTEIANQSGLSKSGAQRFIYTLRELGLVQQEPGSKAYAISPLVLSYSRTFFSSNSLYERAGPVLQALADETGETVNLSEIAGRDLVFTMRFPSKHSVSVNLSVGSRLPVFVSAPARAIIAHWPLDRAQAILKACELTPWTQYTKTDPADLMHELAKIRQTGFACSDQEAFLGDISIAAPVFGFSGECLAAVNVAVPTPRWEKAEALEILMPRVISTSKHLSAELGQR